MKRALTIGPSDSSGVTGIQADLRVWDALEVAGLSAVTEVLAAREGEARRRFRVPPRLVEAQIDAVARGGLDAVKVAGLYDRTLVETVSERVRRRRLKPVVLDPGIVDARGERVLGRSGVEWLRKRLLPQVAVVVLRAAEAEILGGGPITDAPSLQAAIEQVRRSGVGAVVATGLAAEDDAVWVLDEEGFRSLAGCVPQGSGARDRFTAALTARLALGDGVGAALTFAIDSVGREEGKG